MVIEVSGVVKLGLKTYAWFQNWTSAQREFELKSQVWFQAKIAGHAVQLLLYYNHFSCNLICYFEQDLKYVWLCCLSVPFSLAGKTMRFRANNGAIWEYWITLLRANQISRIVSDFKVNVMKAEIRAVDSQQELTI